MKTSIMVTQLACSMVLAFAAAHWLGQQGASPVVAVGAGGLIGCAAFFGIRAVKL